jgi:hypothetical protein
VKTNFVIYTDKLSEVRDFWDEYFHTYSFTELQDGFGIMIYGDSFVLFLDAAAHDKPVTRNAAIRIRSQQPELEHGRLDETGWEVSPMKDDHWGPAFEDVEYFSFADPSGTTFEIFDDHVGESKRFTLKRDV